MKVSKVEEKPEDEKREGGHAIIIGLECPPLRISLLTAKEEEGPSETG